MKTNYIEQAIRKAESAGWSRKPYMCDHEGIEMMNKGAFLDPSFWKSLGKAMGWGKTKDDGELKGESLLNLWPEEWQVYWHVFIDHLAAGKDPQDYFKDILSQ